MQINWCFNFIKKKLRINLHTFVLNEEHCPVHLHFIKCSILSVMLYCLHYIILSQHVAQIIIVVVTAETNQDRYRAVYLKMIRRMERIDFRMSSYMEAITWVKMYISGLNLIHMMKPLASLNLTIKILQLDGI